MTMPTNAYCSDSEQQGDAPQTDNPKRSREGSRKRMMRMTGLSRYQADTFRAYVGRLHPDFEDQWMKMLGKKQTTVTILTCVAKFKLEDQPRAFVLFSDMGSRAAKRWIECANNPPTIDAIARRVTKWLAREFPNVPNDHIVAALLAVAETKNESLDDD